MPFDFPSRHVSGEGNTTHTHTKKQLGILKKNISIFKNSKNCSSKFCLFACLNSEKIRVKVDELQVIFFFFSNIPLLKRNSLCQPVLPAN